MDLKKNLVVFGKKALFNLKKYSPELMTGGAIVCGVGTVVLTWIAARKHDKALEEPKMIIETAKSMEITETYTKKDQQHDICLGYWKSALAYIKLYGPAALMGGFSIACVLGSHRVLSRRYGQAVAANGILMKELKDCENYISEKYGKEEVDKMRLAGKTETVTETVKDENGEEKTVEKTVAKEGYDKRTFDRLFDETNPNWKSDGQYNYTVLVNMLSQVNSKLHAKGYLTLNEVYDEFGIPKTQAGFQYGWICDPEDPYKTWITIGYDLKEKENDPALHALIKYNMGILLHFNCDKMIWSKLPYEEA